MIPPQNLEAERAALGSVLLDNDAMDHLEALEREHFYGEFHREVFTCMKRLRDRGAGIDIVSLTEEMRRRGNLQDENDALYILGLAETVPVSSNAPQYADIVVRHAQKRDLLNLGMWLQSSARNPDLTADEIRAQLEESLTKATLTVKRGPSRYVDSALTILDDERKDIYSTGYPTLDRILGGGLRGLSIIAGRPSMGKSSLARSIGLNNARAGRKVALFTQDQGGSDVYRLIASSDARVPLDRIANREATPDEIERWKRSLESMRRSFAQRFVVDDYPYNITHLASRIRAAARWGAEVVIIDYLQLIHVPGSSVDRNVASVSHVSMALKHLAQELGILVLALAQLNRAVEMRRDKRPMMSDLRESGQIEQDAEAILFVYRDEYYNARMEGRPEVKRSPAEVIVAKNKTGKTGMASLTWSAELTEFS